MTYEGEEVVGDWGQAGPATSVVEIWHAPGGVTLAQAVPAAPDWSGEAPHIVAPASSLGGQAMVGTVMLGMSQRLVSLLGANYQVMAVGRGQVAGAQGADRHGAPRRRAGRAVLAGPGHHAAAAPGDLRRGGPHRQHCQLHGADRGRRRGRDASGRGPPAVGHRPAGPVARRGLAAARAAARRPGFARRAAGHHRHRPVVDLDYSDGLCLVSVFLERGHLPVEDDRLVGGSSLRGRQVYADDSAGQGIVWSARGFVYTLVAAAPAQTVEQVVAALPHDSSPGLLGRLGPGLHRLLSWLSP